MCSARGVLVEVVGTATYPKWVLFIKTLSTNAIQHSAHKSWYVYKVLRVRIIDYDLRVGITSEILFVLKAFLSANELSIQIETRG